MQSKQYGYNTLILMAQQGSTKQEEKKEWRVAQSVGTSERMMRYNNIYIKNMRQVWCVLYPFWTTIKICKCIRVTIINRIGNNMK